MVRGIGAAHGWDLPGLHQTTVETHNSLNVDTASRHKLVH